MKFIIKSRFNYYLGFKPKSPVACMGILEWGPKSNAHRFDTLKDAEDYELFPGIGIYSMGHVVEEIEDLEDPLSVNQKIMGVW